MTVEIPKLSCGKVFILALAIDFISMPIRVELEIFISNKLKGCSFVNIYT